MKEKIIFVVDDDKLIRHFLEYSFIGKEGYSVMVFSNAEECLKAMHTNPNVIILDHSFIGNNEPLMTGLEALIKIREINDSVPVIVLSKSEDDELIGQYKSNGATAYILKEGCFVNTLFDTFDSLRLN